MRNFTYKTCLLALGMSFLAACGGKQNPQSACPPPGSVVVLSVTALPEDPPPNLLSNGDFHEWYGGLNFPSDFQAPVNEASSTTARDIMHGYLDTRGYTARQSWTAVDLDEAPAERFGTTCVLQPNQDYTFAVVASASPGMVAHISAYAIDDGGAVGLLAGNLVEIDQEKAQRYTGKFRTDHRVNVLLVSQVSPLATLPGTVIWSEWALHENNNALDQSEDIHRRLWVTNSLAHVQQQTELYGGVATWSESLLPLHKNLDRFYRETEGQEGSAVLGYDEFIFQKADLAYANNVRDFVREKTEQGMGIRPALTALLRLDRALKGRGKDLIILPLPDRVHLYVDKINKRALELPPSYLPHTRFVTTLLEQGAIAVDVAPLLFHRRHEENPVYHRGDFGVSAFTLSEIAGYVAPMIRDAVSIPESAAAFNAVTETVLLHQGAVPALPKSQQSLIGPESNSIEKITDPDGALFAPAATSAVLVVGSMSNNNAARGASLAAYLSAKLGTPVSILGANLEDQEVPQHLLTANPPELEAAQVVLYCFPEYALVRPGW